jgi:membrane-associated phospholipid phosphatase
MRAGQASAEAGTVGEYFFGLWFVAIACWTGGTVLCQLRAVRIVPDLQVLAPIGALLCIAVIYGPATGRAPKLASTCSALALSMFSGYAMGTLQYAMVVHSGQLNDRLLDTIDQALGFDWKALFDWTVATPWAYHPLRWAYLSLAPQVMLTALYLSWTSQRRLLEAMTIMISLGVVTLGVSALLPSGNAAALHGVDLVPFTEWNAMIARLRSGQPETIDTVIGIISFPSLHTMMALALIYVFRDTRLRYAVVPLNIALIAATPVFGGHYLVDTLAGLAIGPIVIWACSRAVSAARGTPNPSR